MCRGKLRQWPGAYRAARRSDWGAQWPNWLARKRDKPRQQRSRGAANGEGAESMPQVEIVWPTTSKREGREGGASGAK